MEIVERLVNVEDWMQGMGTNVWIDKQVLYKRFQIVKIFFVYYYNGYLLLYIFLGIFMYKFKCKILFKVWVQVSWYNNIVSEVVNKGDKNISVILNICVFFNFDINLYF